MLPLTPGEIGLNRAVPERSTPVQTQVVAASYSVVFESLQHFILELQTTNTAMIDALAEQLVAPHFISFEDLARLKLSAAHEHGAKEAYHRIATQLEVLQGDHSGKDHSHA